MKHISAFLIGICTTACVWAQPIHVDPDLTERTNRAIEAGNNALGNRGNRQNGHQIPHIAPEQTRLPARSIDPLALARALESKKPIPVGNVLVFVSLDMPQSSLQRLAKDSGRFGSQSVMVLRGLQKASLKKTNELMLPFIKMGAQFMIDPESFKRHSVQVVPSFAVEYAGSESCSEESKKCSKASVLLEGDVSLLYALENMTKLSNDKSLATLLQQHVEHAKKLGLR